MLPREDSWGIMNLQNCILSIAEYIDSFCETNGIDYCLMGGSALGAVRHKGFIPWDDDLDIFMRPDDYERFRTSFANSGDHDRFYLQEWGSKNGKPSFAKLRLNTSSYDEPDLERFDIHKGVFVDIFILHTCPDNMLCRIHQYLWARYLVLKSLANRGYARRGIIVKYGLKLLALFPKRFLVDFALRQVYRYRNEDSKYLCHFLGRAGYKKGLYLKDYFRETKKVDFESIQLRVPSKVEDYLRDRWGNYMQIPSAEEIKYYQHSADWSDAVSFDGYKADGNYKDEPYLIV